MVSIYYILDILYNHKYISYLHIFVIYVIDYISYIITYLHYVPYIITNMYDINEYTYIHVIIYAM